MTVCQTVLTSIERHDTGHNDLLPLFLCVICSVSPNPSEGCYTNFCVETVKKYPSPSVQKFARQKNKQTTTKSSGNKQRSRAV